MVDLEIIFQLFLAAILGGLLGLEREYRRKEAGLRTFSLVSLGSALFTIISFEIFNSNFANSFTAIDPTRIIGQIVVGVGFIGAGLIIYRQFHIEGVTTAAGIWVSAAIGTGIGAKLYLPAVFATFLAMAILSVLRLLEERIFGKELPKEKS